jgi:nicotinamide mononucleotide adenylyltransferase
VEISPLEAGGVVATALASLGAGFKVGWSWFTAQLAKEQDQNVTERDRHAREELDQRDRFAMMLKAESDRHSNEENAERARNAIEIEKWRTAYAEMVKTVTTALHGGSS